MELQFWLHGHDVISRKIFSGNLHIHWKIELIFDTFPENVISSVCAL